MPPEVLGRIFEAFYTTKGEGKGTGLGLMTVNTVVNAHGGFLAVESEVGRGTRFTISVPAIPGAEEEESLSGDERSTNFPKGAGECILIVDDEVNVRNIMQRILGSFDYRSFAAADGLEAIQMFNEHSGEIRLVITDVEVSQVGGPALAQILRGLDQNLPILLMGAARQTAGAIAAGHAKEYITKPFVLAELLQAVRRNLHPAES